MNEYTSWIIVTGNNESAVHAKHTGCYDNRPARRHFRIIFSNNLLPFAQLPTFTYNTSQWEWFLFARDYPLRVVRDLSFVTHIVKTTTHINLNTFIISKWFKITILTQYLFKKKNENMKYFYLSNSTEICFILRFLHKIKISLGDGVRVWNICDS